MKKLVLLSFLFLVIGCSGNNQIVNSELGGWKYSDLRAVDPSDLTNPSQDIIAVYSRGKGDDLQIRIDFLDLKSDDPLNQNLVIMFDNGAGENHSLPYGVPGSSKWNLLLYLSPEGHAILTNPKGETVVSTRVSIYRDSNLDAIIVLINKSSISDLSIKTQIEILSVNFTPKEIEIDTLEPFKLYSPPPPPGNVLISFWNTFYADTPAQALRSWDGAHTGPFSSRHGLKSLIDAVDATSVPVVLLDLNRPKNMSVLDYLGVQGLVLKLVDQGTIILAKPGYSLSPNLIQSIVETTDASENTLSDEIPSLSTRKKLVEYSIQPGSALLLGGDFAKSRWGNYNYAIQTLTYIKNHPWIKPISDRSILQPPKSPVDDLTDPLIGEIKTILSSSPGNPIRQVAEELLTMLISSNAPGDEEIRHQNLGQIGHLIAISKWSQDRQAIVDCSADFDWDHQPECILASETLAMVVDMQGGYISYAFTFHEGKFHQIIGPSIQLVTRLNDVIKWNLFNTINSDQSIIPGAFADVNWNLQKFTPILIEPGKVSLQEEYGQALKTFRLTKDGIQFSYEGWDQDKLVIPLIVDPWTMKLPDWGNQFQNKTAPDVIEWGIPQEVVVSIHSGNPVEFYSFKDSSEVIRIPENPNYAYPIGHFLPFPFAVGILNTNAEGIISLNLTY